MTSVRLFSLLASHSPQKGQRGEFFLHYTCGNYQTLHGDSRGVYPCRTLGIDRQSFQNVCLIFRTRGHISHYFLVSTVTVELFFCKCWASHCRSCNWLVAHNPSLHPTDKHSHSCLFLATFTQGWPLIGPGCHIGQPRTHGFQSGGYKYSVLQSWWPCPLTPSAQWRKSKHPVSSCS